MLSERLKGKILFDIRAREKEDMSKMLIDEAARQFAMALKASTDVTKSMKPEEAEKFAIRALENYEKMYALMTPEEFREYVNVCAEEEKYVDDCIL